MVSKTKVKKWCYGLGLLTVLSVPIVHAGVYEWVDALGRNHYADRNRENARVLDVESGQQKGFVERVYDGDTIVLADGRRVRLLGINTPEIAGRFKTAESGGEQAKAWLKQQIEHKKVRLEFDVEKQDKYQRTLAHVFGENDLHVNVELVRQGLATANIYPPNLKYIDELAKAQQSAENGKLGIWNDPAYAPQSYSAITDQDYKGWRRVTGQVQGLKKSRQYSYLQFSSQFSLQIANQSLASFPALKSYQGKHLEVRGWINKSKQGFTLRVSHPLEIKVLD